MAKKKRAWDRPEARVNLYLPHEVVRKIDKQARYCDTNRSQWIQYLVRCHELGLLKQA